MRKISFTLLFILLAALLVLPCTAYAPVVKDPDGFLNPYEQSKLSEACNCSDYGTTLYVLLRKDLTSAPSVSAVRTALSIPDGADAVVLVVRHVYSVYYYDMYTFGEAEHIFSDADVDRILDDPKVYNNIKEGNLVDGCRAFTDLCHDVVEEHHLAEQEKARLAPLTAVLVGAISGLVVGGITVLCVFLVYRKKQHGESYPLDRYAKLNLTQSNDIFVGSHVTRVRIQSNSSGGRSGGGGGSHRGGR